MSGAQAKAARICGAICVVAETSETALKKRHSQGWVDEMSTSISHLLTTIRRYISSNGAQSKTGGVSIGYQGNVVDVWEALAALDGDDRIEIGLGSDQTS